MQGSTTEVNIDSHRLRWLPAYTPDSRIRPSLCRWCYCLRACHMDVWATSARIFSLVRGKDPPQSKEGQSHAPVLWERVFAGDLLHAVHLWRSLQVAWLWNCQEGMDNLLCSPVLPPKQKVSKIAVQRCRLHLRCVLKCWWESEKFLWKWPLVIALILFVGKFLPETNLLGWLGNRAAPRGQCTCWESLLSGLPWHSSPDAQRWPQGFCTPLEAQTLHIWAAHPGLLTRGCSWGLCSSMHGAQQMCIPFSRDWSLVTPCATQPNDGIFLGV